MSRLKKNDLWWSVWSNLAPDSDCDSQRTSKETYTLCWPEEKPQDQEWWPPRLPSEEDGICHNNWQRWSLHLEPPWFCCSSRCTCCVKLWLATKVMDDQRDYARRDQYLLLFHGSWILSFRGNTDDWLDFVLQLLDICEETRAFEKQWRRCRRSGGVLILSSRVVVKGYIYSNEEFTSKSFLIQNREFEV